MTTGRVFRAILLVMKVWGFIALICAVAVALAVYLPWWVLALVIAVAWFVVSVLIALDE